MVTVVEWATIVRPVGRFPWAAYLFPFVAIVGMSAWGAQSAVALSKGFLEIAFWISLGVIPVVGAGLLLSRKLAAVRSEARAATDRVPDSEIRLFSSSAIGDGISGWRDWRKSDVTGEGFLQIGQHDLRIWTARDGLERISAWDRVAYVEDVRLWGRGVWSPQLRVCFTDGSQFIASLDHAGLASVLGVSGSEMRRLGEVFESRVPGLCARVRTG